MKDTWATSGVDLFVDVNGGRTRAALESALRQAVADGRLATGTRLPSSRSLSVDLRMARNTVAEAYAQLVSEGWLESRIGAGTWVAERSKLTAVPTPGQPERNPSPVALCPGVSDLSSFPRQAWYRATKRALLAAHHDAFAYADPHGLVELRTALAGYLSRVRHVVVRPDNIIVCAGTGHGVALMCEVIRRRGGQTLAVEAYGYPDLWDIAAATGLRLVPMPVDDQGAVVERCFEADAVMLTPGHQFPWGVSLHPGRRRQVLEWAAASSAIVLEDDYDGEFRYDRQPVGALQALAPGQITYVGTTSKSLAPGIRLGWLVLPNELIGEVAEVKRTRGVACSSIDQLIMAELINSGAYDRLVRRARLQHRRQREHLVAALRDRAPGVVVQGAAAGLQTVLILPPGQTEAEVLDRGRKAGLHLFGLGRTFTHPDGSGPPALVVGFGHPSGHAFHVAVDRLCDVLA